MNHTDTARDCEEFAARQPRHGNHRAVTALARFDTLMPLALIAWLCALVLDTAGPVGNPWPNVFDLAGLAIMSAIILRRGDQLWLRPAFLVAVACFFWLTARTPALQANTQVGQAILFLLALACGIALRSQRGAHWHRAILLAGGAMLAATLLAEATGHGAWLSDHWNLEPQLSGGWRRWAGPTAHPNLLAYLCSLLLWAGLSFRWRGQRWQAAAALALGVLLGVCLFGTLSRSGWLLAAAVAAAGSIWLFVRARRTALPVALPAVLLLAGTLGAFGGMALARPDLIAARAGTVLRQINPTPDAFRGNPEADIVSRGNVYRDALQCIAEAPLLGHGLAAYDRIGHYKALHSHQLGLELLLMGGIPALVGVLGGLLWAAWRGHGAFLRGVLLIALFSGLSDMVFFFKWPALWLAFSLGLALRRARPSAWAHTRAARFAVRYGSVFTIFLCMAFTYQLREEYSMDFHAYYGAMRWNAESGQPPYLTWTGQVFGTDDDEFSRYLRKFQTDLNSYSLQFLYPPTAFAQLRPFTWIEDPATAVRVWRLFNLAALGGCVVLGLQFLPRAMRPGAALFLCLLTVSYAPVRDTLWLGQVSIWVSFLMFAFFWSLHARRPVLAGTLLAVATALKIYPVFWCIAALMYPGQRIRAGAGFVLAMGAMLALSLAMDGTEVWHSYWDNVISKMGDAPPLGGVTLYPLVGSRDDLANSIAHVWANRLATVAIPAACGAYLWTLRHRGTSRKLLGFTSVTAVLFLSLPLVWGHYLVLLGALLAISCVRWIPRGFRAAPCAVALLAAAYLLTGQMWLAEALMGHRTTRFMTLGLVAAAALPMAFAWERRFRRARRHAVASP